MRAKALRFILLHERFASDGDALFDVGTDFFRLGQRGDNSPLHFGRPFHAFLKFPFRQKQGAGEILHHGLAMDGGTPQDPASFTVSHGFVLGQAFSE